MEPKKVQYQMLQVSSLHKAFGSQVVFDGAGFTVGRGERVGFVGRNGSGKSTLLQMILGDMTYDSGSISTPTGYKVGHLAQHLALRADTVLGEGALALPHNDDGIDESYKVETILQGLGFSAEDMSISPKELSGGFQVRLSLAKALVSEPDLLLLDEPTNYLDIVSIRWLGNFLRSWHGELLLITHDRQFMDTVTTHTMAIHRTKIIKHPGPTHKLFEQIIQAEEHHEKARLNEERKRKDAERFINRFRAQATRATAVQSRIKALNKQGILEKRGTERNLDFSFNEASFVGKWMLESEGLGFGFNSEDGLLFKGLNLRVCPGDRIAVVGRNGAGKTTLLNVLAGELEATEGNARLNSKASMAYFGQTNIDRLNPEHTVVDEILEVAPALSPNGARNIAGAMMFKGDEAMKKIKVLSGGERSRVLLGRLLASPANLLLLDEPTNHLDMQSVDSLLEAVGEFKGAVLMVTHSEMVLRAFAQRLIVFEPGGARVFEGTYDDFLLKGGWHDDDSEVKPKSTQKKTGSKKENRRARAAIMQERTRELRPLAKKIATLELEIMELEGQLEADDTALAEAATKGEAEEITALSKATHEARQRIDKKFAQLEDATVRHDSLALEYKQKL